MSLLLATMDITIVNVALPAIQSDMGASITGLEWSIDAYTIVGASFLLAAGSTADRIGRKKIFQTGLVLFSLGSLLCSISTTTTTLVLARALQAFGGSMLNPVAMAIIANTFTEVRARARAIGLWGATAGISMSIGPPLGGFLTQNMGWRSIFWINVPIGLIACILTARYVPESKAAKTRRFDPVGQALVVIVLASGIWSLVEGPKIGWRSEQVIGALSTFACASAVLFRYEKSRFEPLVDVRFFRSIRFSSATLIAIIAFTAFSGFLFLNSLYLQEVRGFSPSRTGLCLLPMALMMMCCSAVSGRLVGSGHARLAMIISGAAVSCSASVVLAIGEDGTLILMLAAYAIFGLGFGMINAPITHAGVSSMPNAYAGLAAAFGATSRQVGASLGVALAGASMGAQIDVHFISSTASFWWLIVASGLAIISLGVLSTGEMARAGDVKVAELLR